MTRLFLLLLAVSASPAHAQAVRPAPAPSTGPLIQQQPPSYPGATYTPPGAGASHGSLPGTQKATLPPSPNKRLLPPSKEPGLWAADGAPRFMILEEVPRILDVPIPFAPSATTDKERHLTRLCAYRMNDALLGMDLLRRAKVLPPKERACVAGMLYGHCASTAWEALREVHSAGVVYSAALTKRTRETQQVADAFRKAMCDGVVLSPEAEAIVTDVQNATAHQGVVP